MIMPNISIPVKCPKCGSENDKSRWTRTTVIAWMSRLPGAHTAKIYDKKCEACGHEFQIFQK